MRDSVLFRLCVITFLLCSAGQVSSQSLQSRIDSLVNQYVVKFNFMGTVLVADRDTVVFTRGYGLADVDQNIPNTAETKFMIGSITKQLTAMMVMQLVEKGELKLDDKISQFVPSFPRELGDKITVGMLLSHRSGLIFPEGIEKYYSATTKDEFLQTFIKQQDAEGLRFEPGEGYGYSNAGYFILGLIIEKVTGKSYETILKQQILQPLGMMNTGCIRKGLLLDNMAHSYQKLPDRYITWNDDLYGYNPEIVGFGFGNLYSTVRDLFKFSKALSTDRLLSKKYLDMYLQMRTVKTSPPIPNIPQELVDEFFGTCGSGFVGEIAVTEDPKTKEKVTCYWHDGTYKLFKSNHFHYSGKEQTIIICSNCSFLCEGNEMVLRIYRMINDKPYEHIHIKYSLSQYVSEDIAMHAGIPAAVGEYLRFKDDTTDFIVPDQEYLLMQGQYITELGDFDNAILILQTTVSEFPEFWKGYDALAEAHLLQGDSAAAIQCYRKSLELNPQNDATRKALKQLTGE